MNDKVTVLMPVYNAERYLREAIDSILNQTFADFEFLIIDDGSTDRSVEIIKSYADSRIRLLQNDKNRGICYTLNRGIEEIHSRYIVRMDADDIAEPCRIEWQVGFMDKHPEVGASGGDLIIFGERIEPHPVAMNHNAYECRAQLLFNSSMAHPSTIIRRELLDEHKIRYREEYSGIEDFELWWQISKHSFIVNQKETLLRYRKHPRQITAIDRKNKTEQQKRAERFVGERFADLGVVLDDDEKMVVSLYQIGLYQNFNLDDVTHFADAIRKAANAYNADNKLLRAIRKIASLAFLNIINATMHSDNWGICMRYAVQCGIMPRWFFFKHLIYHKLRR